MTVSVDNYLDASFCDALAQGLCRPVVAISLCEMPRVSVKFSSVHLAFDDVADCNVHPEDEFVDFEALYDEISSGPGMANHLREAGKRIVETYYAEEGETFRALRLYSSLSQAQLAKAIGTSQSHIARIESGATSDLKLSTLRKLAIALDVEVGRLDAALRATEEWAERTT